MFRKLGSLLERKKNQIQEKVGKKASLEALVADFVSANFSQAAELFSLRSLKYENNNLYLEFKNKAVANEMKLRSSKLIVYMSEKKVNLRNVIIK
jgi:hypothetical protein